MAYTINVSFDSVAPPLGTEGDVDYNPTSLSVPAGETPVTFDLPTPDGSEPGGATYILAIVFANADLVLGVDAGDFFLPEGARWLEESSWEGPPGSAPESSWVMVMTPQAYEIHVLALADQPKVLMCRLYFFSTGVGLWYSDQELSLTAASGTQFVVQEPRGMQATSQKQYFSDWRGNQPSTDSIFIAPGLKISQIKLYGMEANNENAFLRGIEVTYHTGDGPVIKSNGVLSGTTTTVDFASDEYLVSFHWNTMLRPGTSSPVVGNIATMTFEVWNNTQKQSTSRTVAPQAGHFHGTHFQIEGRDYQSLPKPIIALNGFLGLGDILIPGDATGQFPVAFGGVFGQPLA